MTILKPPAVPRPSTGGAPKTLISPSLDFALEESLELRGDRVGRRARVGPVVKLVEHHVHRAEIGRIGVHQDRLARDRHGVLDSGQIVGQFLDRAHGHLRPLERRRVGQLHVDQQVALVLRRDEAGRRVG